MYYMSVSVYRAACAGAKGEPDDDGAGWLTSGSDYLGQRACRVVVGSSWCRLLPCHWCLACSRSAPVPINRSRGKAVCGLLETAAPAGLLRLPVPWLAACFAIGYQSYAQRLCHWSGPLGLSLG